MLSDIYKQPQTPELLLVMVVFISVNYKSNHLHKVNGQFCLKSKLFCRDGIRKF